MTESAKYAPIALFAYARVDHLAATVDSLLTNAECEKTHLHVYCDGPRSIEHQMQIDAVRTYVESISGFASVTRIYRDQNLGLARSIISGVSEVLSTHDSIIVMEDDLEVSPHFLKYMNEGLRRYQDQERVASIHGYCYPVDNSLPETFFLRGADCWGWATWRRAWAHFEPDGQKLLDSLLRKHLTKDFDLGGAYPYTKMLADQVAGKNNSWAVRWHASCYLDNMLTLYPGRSLVNNIGTDDSGTHCATTDEFFQTVAASPVAIGEIPLEASQLAEASFAQFFRKNRSVGARVVRKFRALWAGLA